VMTYVCQLTANRLRSAIVPAALESWGREIGRLRNTSTPTPDFAALAGLVSDRN
jgi:hypothetical protein